jgi:hypothetical protein
MQKWTDMGHAMRRRVGAPSNHLEAAESDNTRYHDTLDEHYEDAKQANSPRIPIGYEEKEEGHAMISDRQDADDYTANAASPEKGTLMPKHNVQAMDPTAGGKANRSNVLYNEELGASYRVSVSTPATVDPTVGPTMANSRVIPSVMGRQNPNFMDALNDQY